MVVISWFINQLNHIRGGPILRGIWDFTRCVYGYEWDMNGIFIGISWVVARLMGLNGMPVLVWE